MGYLRLIVVGTAVACMVAVALAGAALASASAPGVTALPNRPVCPGPASLGAADCHARVITDRGGTPMATAGPTGYSPAQLHSAYELPTSAPTPQTIAIVDAYDDPTIESDLAVYNATFGLPPCTTANGCFLKVNQSGNQGPYPKADPGWALEIALDVETAHAICQNCKILLVETDSAYFSDLTVGVETAAELGATQISNSYGGPEYSGEKSDLSYKYPGIAVTVSAGDGGYAAEYPASSPYVVAVGGTTLSLGASNSYGSESVWSGSGSGCSAYLSAQSWQTADPKWGLTGCGSKRGVADVAADADPNSGASIYDTTKYQGQSGWFKVGGTSLSAPLIAGVYALAGGSSADYPAADPYGHQTDAPAGLHDITTGTNGSCGGSTMCKGAVGYDGPTGVGTPKGVAAFGSVGGATDTTPPQTTIDSGPSGPTNSATPTFAFSSSEAGSTFECRVDAASFSVCTSPKTTAALADGSHSFEVRATDKAANTDPSPAARSFSVDTAAPQVDLTSPAAGSTTANPTPAISGTAGIAAGDSATVTVKVYAGTGTGGTLLQTRSATRDPATGAYSVAAAALGSGTYTAQASQSDSAANTGLSPARTFSVDVTAPTSQAGAAASTNATSLNVTYIASDANSGLATVELWVKPAGAGSYEKAATDSSPGASGSFPYTAAAGDGTYSFYTRATDQLGNYEAAPGSADATTVVDTTPPETTIDSGPSGPTNSSTPTFAFSSSEAGSTFECRVDAASFSVCTSPKITAALADGSHSFEVRAIDKAANTDPSPASRSFSVDTAGPQVDLTSPAAGSLTANPTPALSGTAGIAAGDSATVTVKVYAGTGTGGTLLQTRSASRDPSTGAYSVAATSLATGTYTAQASQSDSAANTGLSPVRTFSVDVTPPQTTIVSGPSGATNDPTPTFAFSSSEAGSTFECRVDAAGFSSCSSQFTTLPLADGPHTFEVRATDPAGNTGAAAARAFSVDSSLQDPAVEEPPAEEPLPPAPAPLAEPVLVPGLLITPAPPPATLRLGRARIDTGGTSATLAVRIGAPGQLVLSGRKVRRVGRELSSAGKVALPVRLRRRFLSPLGPATVTVTYTPATGTPIVKSTTVPFG